MHAPGDPPDLADLPLQSLPGVGDALAEKLAQLQVRSVQDLLFHLPLRYQDRTHVTPIGDLRIGGTALIEGTVEHTEVTARGRRSLLCLLSDGTGNLLLRFFHFSHAQQRALQHSIRLRCYGEVRRGPTMLEMVHPEYNRLTDASEPLRKTLTPIYPSTAGIHQITLRKITEQALEKLVQHRLSADFLPPHLAKKAHFASLSDALRFVHRPPVGTELAALQDARHPAVRRLAFEELVAYRLAMLDVRADVQQTSAPRLHPAPQFVRRLSAQFGFTLTSAQQRVIAEVAADMDRDIPMLRLVQGDVGAGKTVVAAAAAAMAIANGHQAALMAPTEILAEQHFTNLQQWFAPLEIRVGWLIGKQATRARRQTRQDLQAGSIQLVVGTHALFQSDIIFQSLALTIIDEQHRFGVDQRMALRDKGRLVTGQQREMRPHQMTLSATPIPRTLSMTAYADLDCSVLDELPPGRVPVTTVAIANTRRDEVVARIGAVIARGRQAYWVCPLIGESEVLQCRAAEETFSQLTAMLPTGQLALLHGRMKGEEKDTIMRAFKAGEIDLLVATTVIEVGVDVANASLMIIENAERFGLSQLHQLRGRIGRGSAGGSCVLLYQPPLIGSARQRIATLRETNDGFAIAERDLALRGAGDVLGTQQAGEARLRIADLARDGDMLDEVKVLADYLQSATPATIPALIRRWRGGTTAYRHI